MTVKTLSILGATGSIGRGVADVVAHSPHLFSVQALTAHRNVKRLVQTCRALRPQKAVIADETLYQDLKAELVGTGIACAAGPQAIEEAAQMPADLVVCAIVGLVGLRPLLKAIEQGKSVAIANKEPLVAAGSLVMAAARKAGTTILPLDSEHNAIFQLLPPPPAGGGLGGGSLERIILTASGGPFWTWDAARMATATVDQALAHPTWTMGRKISIDSATMMNKALEILEAHHLFGLSPTQIEVLIHPQSIVHGIVVHADGSWLAHMGPNDMRTPIAHVLAYPTRMKTSGRTLSLADISTLTFAPPDNARFPALPLAYSCLQSGPAACIALNAANEVAVEAFLNNHLVFGKIMACIDHALEHSYDTGSIETVEAIQVLDEKVRADTKHFIKEAL